jgi:hypothetical protein
VNPQYDAKLRYRERNIAEGRCRDCPLPRMTKRDGTPSVFCSECAARRRQKRRQARAAKLDTYWRAKGIRVDDEVLRIAVREAKS